jgi:hypothetical protein
MTRTKLGAILISIWSGTNLLLATAIVGAMVIVRRHPPSLAMFVGDEAARTLPPNALALVDALGVLANGCIAALCALTLVVTWTGLLRRSRGVFAALAAPLLLVQAIGYASDAYLGNRNVGLNVISSAILAVGLALSAPGREVPNA